MILALAARVGCIVLNVADRISRRAAFDAHVAAALALTEPLPPEVAAKVAEVNPGWREARAAFEDADAAWDDFTCDAGLWTDAELIELAPDLAVLDAVTTYDDFVYLTGGDQ